MWFYNWRLDNPRLTASVYTHNYHTFPISLCSQSVADALLDVLVPHDPLLPYAASTVLFSCLLNEALLHLFVLKKTLIAIITFSFASIFVSRLTQSSFFLFTFCLQSHGLLWQVKALSLEILLIRVFWKL